MSFARLLGRAMLGGLSLLATLAATTVPADAGVTVLVSQSTQSMHVYVDGMLAHVWPVSTARRGYVTPNGNYRVGMMAPMWYSRKYHMSPMPHAMFFRGGYAIHGTYAVGHLGRRASHGCIRLAPGHAQALYRMTRTYGGTQVVIRN